MPPNPDAAAWSSYWRSGAEHSCPGSFGDHYGGVIAQFWRDVLAEVQPGARILDVATGNGPLPRMLAEHFSADDGLLVDAIDAAEIAPGWHDTVRHRWIRFHSGIAMERMPFASGTFDWILSQFGLEYAGPEAARECARLLKPGGQMAMVVHHADSRIVRVAEIEAGHYRRLIAPDGAIDAALGVLPFIAASNDPGAMDRLRHDPQAELARSRYNSAQQALGRLIEEEQVPDVLIEAREILHRIVVSSPAIGLGQSAEMLERYGASVRDAQERNAQLRTAAMTQIQLSSLLNGLANTLDVNPTISVLAQAEGILGWGVRLRASPAA